MISPHGQAGTSAPPLPDQPRRFACDRCRGQKLRCERLSSTDDICRRCLRVNARCITTASHRLNRGSASLHANITTSSTSTPGPSSSLFLLDGLGTDPDSRDLAPANYPASPSHHERPQSPQVSLEQSHRLPSSHVHERDDDPIFMNAVFESVFTESPSAPAPSSPTGHRNRPSSSSLDLDLPMQVPVSPERPSDFFDFTKLVSSWPADDSIEPLLTLNPPNPPFAVPSAAGAAFPTSRTQWSQNRPIYQQQNGRQSMPKPPDARSENWNQRFSRMSADLLEDLNLIESGKVAGTLLLSNSTCHSTSSATYVSTSQTGRPHYVIGQMLQSADELLRALRDLGTGSRLRPRPPASVGSGRSHIATTEETSSSDQDGGLSHVDGLLCLLILTCYTTLLRICKGVFLLIRESLPRTADSSSAAAAVASFEPVLPTIQLDGVDVVRRKNLQIRILLQVSAHLITQIEEAMRAVHLQGDGDGIGNGFRGSVLLSPASVEQSQAIRESLGHVSKSIREILEDDDAF